MRSNTAGFILRRERIVTTMEADIVLLFHGVSLIIRKLSNLAFLVFKG